MSKYQAPGKWKPENPPRTNTGSSNIRGKISGPIPLDDDEFPIRTPGTSIATSLPMDGTERQAVIPPTSNTSIAARHESVAFADFANGGLREEHAQVSEGYRGDGTSARGTNNHITSLTTPSNVSDGSPRRKRTLRSVFGRLFGKKRRESSSSNPSQTTATPAHQHGIDTSKINIKARTGGRSVSMPVNEYNRALRSHSDVLPTKEDEEVRRLEARRATTSRLFGLPQVSGQGYDDWTGLSPRPASSHARSSQIITDPIDNDVIGMAVTNGMHPNRRSRSVGQLREASRLPRAIPRRRSDEIRYWRESYDPDMHSPKSSNKAETEEQLLLDDFALPGEHEVVTQPQPFDFGHMGGLAGMKITQAASLETRVSQLETRMHGVEKAVSRILQSPQPLDVHSATFGSAARVWRASGGRPRTASPNSSATRQMSRAQGTRPTQVTSSVMDSRPSTVETQSSSFQPSSLQWAPNRGAAEEGHSMLASYGDARPLSTMTTTTVRGYIPGPSPPPLPHDGRLTIEHYETLSNLMLAEQKARMQLERVVTGLQRDLQDLRVSTGYSTGYTPLAGASEGISTFEHDHSSEASIYNDQDEEFRTPNEEQALGDDIFGRHGDDEKQIGRTLSLSQLTMGSSHPGH